jgi:probable HAF family extracellular repeat protein
MAWIHMQLQPSRRLAMLLAGLVWFAHSAAAQPQTYAITELDFASAGGAGSGMNSAGQVTGSTASSPTNAFITGPNGIGITYLPVPVNSGGTGINASGHVAGVSVANGLYAGFITGANGLGITALPILPGGDNTYPYAINDSGQVTGFSGSQPNVHAFITGANGSQITDVGTLGGGTSAGYAINASGQVTGYSVTTKGGSLPFITGDNGTAIHAINNLGGDYSGGLGINASGQVTGYSNLVANGPYHAFVTGPNGVGISDLGTFGGAESMGRAINTRGQVTGGADLPTGTSQHAFLYSNGVMIDLNTLIDPLSPLAPYVTLQYGTAITDTSSLLVVGSDSRYPGVSQTFILTPAAPVSLTCPTAVAQVGVSYSSKISAAGGSPPYTFSNTGTLPSGLILTRSTGIISGTPTVSNAYAFTATVPDSSGLPSGTATLNCMITVSPAADFSIAASPSSVVIKQGSAAATTVSATALNGFAGPIALSISGLPKGMTAAFSPLAVSGGGSSKLTIDSGIAAPGTYELAVTGTSGVLVHSTPISLTITSARKLRISPNRLFFGSVPRFSLRVKTITLENTGSELVSIYKVFIGDHHEPKRDDFVLVNLCGNSVAPGNRCSIIVVLFAKNVGTVSSMLHIPNNADGSLQGVPISVIVEPDKHW